MEERVIESAREAAADEARNMPLDHLAKMVEGTLRDHGPCSLEAVKAPLRKARTPRMRTCSYYLCDFCSQPIHVADHGFVIHGNIYVADPNCRGGLVGNNFPIVRPGEKIEVTDVQENVFCKKCLVKILNLGEPEVQRPVSLSAEAPSLRGPNLNLGGLSAEASTALRGPGRPGRRQRRPERVWERPSNVADDDTHIDDSQFRRLLDDDI